MNRRTDCSFFVLGFFFAFIRLAFATTTWTGNGSSNLWDDSDNWSPHVPQSSEDAIFGSSSQTSIEVDTQVALSSMTFNAGAPAYSLGIDFLLSFNLSGAGVSNNSGLSQTIATVGGVFNGGSGSSINFHNSASAGSLTLVNAGGTALNSNGGTINFWETATAGSATIVNNGGVAGNAGGGVITFINGSKGGSATITTEGDASDAGNARGAVTIFLANSRAESATLITNGSPTSGAAGGSISFRETANGDTARAITNAGGSFDISLLSNSSMDIGSIEGAGTYLLGSKTLKVGGNNLSTIVSGTIIDNGGGGSIDKVGTGTLTLSGANNYLGATTIENGALVITASGSLGNTAVSVGGPATFTNNGSLAGSVSLAGVTNGQGVFIGPVTVQSGGTLSVTSTINGLLTVNPGALVSLSSGMLTAAGGVVNNGTMRFTHGASLSVTNGHTLTSNTLLDVITGSFSAPAGFINNGTLLDSNVVKAKSLTKAPGTVAIAIDSYTGHAYQLQSSSSPQGVSFANVPAVPVQNGSTGTVLVFTDSSPPPGHGFYRIAVDP